jgi:small-conductance mechanosensitive channel
MKQTLFFLAFVALAALRPEAASAQTPATQAASPAPAALTPAEAQAALTVLQDPQKRDQLIAVLKTIATATPAATPAPTAPSTATTPAAPPAVTLKPNGLGAQLLVALSRWSGRLAGDATATIQAMTNLPTLWRWLTDTATDPVAVRNVSVAIGEAVAIVAVALILELLCVGLLRQPRRRLLARLPSGNGDNIRLSRLLPYVLAGLVLDLVPVAVFAASGNLLAATITALGDETRLVVLAAVNAYATCRAVLCVGRMLVSPDDRRLRLWRLDDADARFVIAWLRRLVVVAVFGDALVSVALLLGLDQNAHDGLERLIALILTAMLIVMVIRSRRSVAGYLRRSRLDTEVPQWRAWLAEVWAYLAVIVILSAWVGVASGTRTGLAALYFPGVALAAVIGARLAVIVVLGALERLLRLDPATQDRLPALAPRLVRYRRPLECVAVTVIAALSGLILLQLWGAPAFAWFAGGSIGYRLVSALATIGIASIAAIAIWELSQAALERHLWRATDGAQIRSVRLLTLLPLLRTTLLATILVVIGLTALSEIGVNIAPLLAGAGIAGIAIGFGSQRLVQDVITGAFVLFENVIRIGDWVTVAGLSGSIEALSVRTMRLRAGDGSVHIIPFSSVTTITNTNRGLGNAAVSVTVALKEDTDRVAQVLADIAADMRQQPEYADGMKSDLQLWGVDAVWPWGVTITGQIPCTDAARWPVQREFNRRVKKCFEELEIEIAGSPQIAARM